MYNFKKRVLKTTERPAHHVRASLLDVEIIFVQTLYESFRFSYRFACLFHLDSELFPEEDRASSQKYLPYNHFLFYAPFSHSSSFITRFILIHNLTIKDDIFSFLWKCFKTNLTS